MTNSANITELSSDGLLPTDRGQAMRYDTFTTLTDALDYAAQGMTGFNFFSARADLKFGLSYRQLRLQACEIAKSLVLYAEKDARIGITATTSVEFVILFMACQYAGLVPAPLPLPITLGGRSSYERQIQRMADTAEFHAIFTSDSMEAIMRSAMNDHTIPVLTFNKVLNLPKGNKMRPHTAQDMCYIQYSSGSSSTPKGVIGTQKSVSTNCRAIIHYGFQTREQDRCCSWLPLYHDMGLVGCLFAPLMCQMTVDYMDSQDFARRPISWLRLLSRHRGTVTSSPTFGYELCVRRWREDCDLDLSAWRVAGIGGDMVRPEPLMEFADMFGGIGFDARNFMPSYGLAETTLAASFTPLRQGLKTHTIDMERYSRSNEAVDISALTPPEQRRTFVACGMSIPGHQIEVRDFENQVLGERKIGRICLKGPSISPGYFRNQQATEVSFSKDGWLDTGDLGYWLENQLVVTGRFKDLILWHGRNIWPQDMEWAAQAAAPHRCGRACAFSAGGVGDEKHIMLLLECRTRDLRLLAEIETAVTAAIRLEVGVPVQLRLVPRGTMIITSSGKLARARVKEKFLEGAVIDLQNQPPMQVVSSASG